MHQTRRSGLRMVALAVLLVGTMVAVGADPAGATDTAQFVWPVSGWTAETAGGHVGACRDPGCPRRHEGLDLRTPNSMYPIVAARSGTVVARETTCRSLTIDHGAGLRTRYVHMNQMIPTIGQTVQQGQVIGYGYEATCGSTAIHLHFEIQNSANGVLVHDAYIADDVTNGNVNVNGYDVWDAAFANAPNNASTQAGVPIPVDFGIESEPPPASDGMGWFRPADGSWHLSNDINATTEHAFVFGVGATYLPITGDWNGDGTDGIGWYRPSDGSWHLSNDLNGTSEYTVVYGVGATYLPITGDWNGDGTDGIGWYRPSDGSWHLSNDLNGTSEHTVVYGVGATYLPITGDWNGDGTDGIGWYRPSDGSWHLSNDLNGTSEHTVVYGVGATYLPITGDWDGDGTDGIGWYRPSDGSWHLSNDLNGTSEHTVVYGVGANRPIAGNWDGI